MPLRRNRGSSGGTQYQMREKMFAIGDDFWVETGSGERAFKVNGKALRIRDTLVIESPAGEELYTIQEKKLRIRDTMEKGFASGPSAEGHPQSGGRIPR